MPRWELTALICAVAAQLLYQWLYRTLVASDDSGLAFWTFSPSVQDVTQSSQAPKAAADPLYLPAVIHGIEVVKQKPDGMFLVDNSELQADTDGLGFRHSLDFEDRANQVAKWGAVLEGRFVSDRQWLEVSAENAVRATETALTELAAEVAAEIAPQKPSTKAAKHKAAKPSSKKPATNKEPSSSKPSQKPPKHKEMVEIREFLTHDCDSPAARVWHVHLEEPGACLSLRPRLSQPGGARTQEVASTTLYGRVSCEGLRAGTLELCYSSSCQDCTEVPVKPEGECGSSFIGYAAASWRCVPEADDP